jgi:hypothetical protein
VIRTPLAAGASFRPDPGVSCLTIPGAEASVRVGLEQANQPGLDSATVDSARSGTAELLLESLLSEDGWADMSFSVTVAVFAPNVGHLRFDPPIGEQQQEMRYPDRIKVELAVLESESLGSALRRAAEGLDLKPRLYHSPGNEVPVNPSEFTPRFVAFRRPEDDHGLSTQLGQMFPRSLITVDADGHAQWNRDLDEMPYSDLVRSGELGLLSGDPLRPYLVLETPQGGGGFLLGWEVLRTVWTVLGGLLATREFARLTQAQAEALRQRLAGARVVEARAEEWSRRRGGPREVRKTISSRPWPLKDLRMVMGLDSPEEAEELLQLFGSVPNENGEYELGSDVETGLLQMAEDDAFQLISMSSGRDVSAAMVRDRLEFLLARGELAEPPRFDDFPS